MGLIRPSVLLFAMIITLPALYRYATDQRIIASFAPAGAERPPAA